MKEVKEEKVEELYVDDWLEILDDLCRNEGYVLLKSDQNLKVALLQLDDTYWRLNDRGKLEAIKKEDAEKILKRDKVDEQNRTKPTRTAGFDEIEPAVEVIKPESQKDVKSVDTTFHIEEFTGIPREFMITMGEPGREQVYVRRAGLLYKAEKKGIRAIQVELQEIDGGYMAKATLYPKIAKEDIEVIKASQGLDPEIQRELLKNVLVPYTEYATATVENVKMKSMHPYLRELACTRASNRVLRAFVACGFTSVEEMPEYVEEE